MRNWVKILIGLVAGVAFGAIFPLFTPYVAPLGTLFIKAIKLLIVPLIFSSLVTGITSMQDIGTLGRISLKTVIIYMATTVCAISIGLLSGIILHPGTGMNLIASETNTTVAAVPSIADTLLGLIPSNPFKAMVEGNILQVIIFTVLLGIAINLTGKKAAPVRKFCESMAETMYSMTAIVIAFAPVGIFALMANVVSQYGLSALLPLLKVLLAVLAGSVIHIILVYGGSVALLARTNPVIFFKGIMEALLVGFSTTSSSGTLPVTTQCMEDNLGVSKSITSFVLPLGATINMDGTAIYQGVCAIFIAQAYNIDLTVGNYLTIIFTATLASIGTAGVPGAGLIMLSMILTAIGLPLEGIALIASIDRLLDMVRTTVNVCGDAMATLLVAKSENEVGEEREMESPCCTTKQRF
ncbi:MULTISPECIES: dicarboxylate/amino acid:cation symporter [unclassified Pseudodesulfovibrio]|uniref:dicarboxylate/amino acid:cation symporter n=1 Tax=unclassified Pseudodesulfovibrio TaxID=2661612 RepID=UPI000FEBCD42|nr:MULTISPECIES: dicarboxylate/amino acid:cation symporter [unclassified Pseudodesulfovibrio]MCJ2163429.1 dicarboxylate/amino acid:cation symporter [Pseudodesulfovibrio sp. S3-i]RWU06666.1 dicarboxylate/amino acid:cation symporter [Pseudodesulfovibrio sp. S3]